MESALEKLKTIDLDDGAAYITTLKAVIDEVGLTDVEVSRILGVSRPSLKRWWEGTHVCHPYLRAKLVELLAAEIAVRIVSPTRKQIFAIRMRGTDCIVHYDENLEALKLSFDKIKGILPSFNLEIVEIEKEHHYGKK